MANLLTFKNEFAMLSQAVVNYTIEQAEEAELRSRMAARMSHVSAGRDKEKRRQDRERLFAVLEENSGLCTAELGRMLGVDRNCMYKKMLKLQDEGAVIRTGSWKKPTWELA